MPKKRKPRKKQQKPQQQQPQQQQQAGAGAVGQQAVGPTDSEVLNKTWAGVLDQAVITLVLEENEGALGDAHRVLCAIAGVERSLDGEEIVSSDHLQELVQRMAEILPDRPRNQLENTLIRCQMDLDAAVHLLSKAAPLKKRGEELTQESSNMFGVLQDDCKEPSAQIDTECTAVDKESVTQLRELFRLTEEQAIEKLCWHEGNCDAAIEQLLHESSAPDDALNLVADPIAGQSDRQDQAREALTNLFPDLDPEQIEQALLKTLFNFEESCSLILNEQLAGAPQEAAPPECSGSSIAVSDSQGNGLVSQRHSSPPPEQDSVLDSMVCALCDLFPTLPRERAEQIVVESEYQMEPAVELGFQAVSSAPQTDPAPLPERDPPATNRSDERKVKIHGRTSVFSAMTALSEKDKISAALRFGKLVGDASGVEIEVLLDLLDKSGYCIARAFEGWLALEDAKLAEQLAEQEAVAAERRVVGDDRFHRNWWPQQVFPEEQPRGSPKRHVLIQLLEYFPEINRNQLRDILDAAGGQLEPAIETVLTMQSCDTEPNDPLLELQSVLVGWSLDQLEDLLQQHCHDLPAALDHALSQQMQGASVESSQDLSNDDLNFLQNIFCEMPLERIGTVLRRNQGNVENSLNDLLLASSEMGGVDDVEASSAVFGIELAQKSQRAKWKLKDLTTRFGHFPRDVLESVLAFNKFQLAKTIQDLNELGGTLLDSSGDRPSSKGAGSAMSQELEDDGFKVVKRRPRSTKPKTAKRFRAGESAGSAEWAHSKSEAARLRRLAIQAGMAMSKYFKEATEAFQNNHKALARELSDKGKHEEVLSRKYHRQACDLVFQEKNPDMGELKEIDLHGLTVKEAISTSTNYLNLCQSVGHRGLLKIITGKGIHSEGGIPKIKPAIEELCQSKGLNFFSSPQGGVIEVALT
eukprot:TRINITY_DN3687_c0_g1_i5.p1 TRINITY_DN3687_c0_g1~~TRINITY_DN3687_c0_g1_i5.p1  ORF type:complete len:923 (+),score=208.61 TRINITY_DN3687_c0_g1_i5:221-2989(+)